MKKIYLLFIALILIGRANAQPSAVPYGFNYQTIARDALGLPIVNTQVKLQISIRQGNASGTIVYQEQQTSTTNQFGLVNLVIGKGVNTGIGTLPNFSSVDWAVDNYFISVEVDKNNAWLSLGVSQFQSVPYSLAADNALKIQGQKISQIAPIAGQYLVFNALTAEWEPANISGANGGTVTSISGLSPVIISGNAAVNPQISIQQSGLGVDGYLSALDWATFNSKIGSANIAGGDLTGTFSNFTVTGLRGSPISTTTPTNGQVLVWNNLLSQWEPASVTSGTVTSVTGNGPITVTNGGSTPSISINQANNLTDGYITQADYLSFTSKLSTSTGFGGDISGTSSAISVDKIKGTSIDLTGIAPGQVLSFNGTSFVPAFISFANSSITSSTLGVTAVGSNFEIGTASGTSFGLLNPLDFNNFNNKVSTIVGLNGISINQLGTAFSVVGQTFTQTQTTLTGINGITVTGIGFDYTIDGQNLQAGSGIQISGNQIVNTSPNIPLTLVGIGASAVTGSANNFTITTPNFISQSTSITGANGVTVAGTGFDLTIGGIAQNLSSSTASVSVNGSNIEIGTASGTSFGLLNPLDFNNFNNRVSTIIGLNGLTINQVGSSYSISGAALNATSIAGINGIAINQSGQGFTLDGSNLLTSVTGANGISINQAGQSFTITGAAASLTSITGIGISVSAIGTNAFTINGASLANLTSLGFGDVTGSLAAGYTVTGLQGAPINKNLIANNSLLQFDGTSIVGYTLTQNYTTITGANGITVAGTGYALTIGGIAQSVTSQTASVTTNGLNFEVGTASGTSFGLLNPIDWTNFNNKLSQPVSIIGVSGAVVSGSYPSFTLAGVNNAWLQGGNSVAVITPFGTATNFDLPFITNGNEALRITSAGDILVNTPTSIVGAKLEIKESATAGRPSVAVLGGPGGSANIVFGRSSAEGGIGIAGSAAFFSNLASPGDIILRAAGANNNLILSAKSASGDIIFSTGTNDTPKMVVSNAGNVSITGNTFVNNLNINSLANGLLSIDGTGRLVIGTVATTANNWNATSGGGAYLPMGAGTTGVGINALPSNSPLTIGTTGTFDIHFVNSTISGGTASIKADQTLELASDNDLNLNTNGLGNIRVKILQTGEVGIGTLTPNQKLTVQGNSSTTGIGYFGTIAGLSLNGASAGSVVTVDGTGKLGFGTLVNNATSQWLTTTNGITINSIVGIGMLPIVNNTFNVKSTGNSTKPIRVENSATTFPLFEIDQGSGGNGNLMLYDNTGTLITQISATNPTFFSGGNNFGIGTIVPNQRLTVIGNSSVTGIGYFETLLGKNLAGASGSIVTVDGFGKLGIGTLPLSASSQWVNTTAGIYYGTSVGIGNLIPVANTNLALKSFNSSGIPFYIERSSSTEQMLRVNEVGNGMEMWFYGLSNSVGVHISTDPIYPTYFTNNIGIGTTNPNQQLSIIGNSSVTGIGYFGTIIGNNLAGAAGSVITVDGAGKMGLGSFTSTTSQWISPSANQIYTNSFVGIGASNPTFPLTIQSNSSSDLAYFESFDPAGSTVNIYNGGVDGARLKLASDGTTFSVENKSSIVGFNFSGNANDFFNYDAANSIIIINPNSGIVNIGKSGSPSNLSVSGNAFANGLTVNNLNGASGSIVTVDGLGKLGIGTLPVANAQSTSITGANGITVAGTGFDLTIGGIAQNIGSSTASVSVNGLNIEIGTASGTSFGLLSPVDFASFNSKVNTIVGLNGITINQVGSNYSITGGNSQWQNNGQSIYYNTSFVGIGTATPSVNLEVNDPASSSLKIRGGSGAYLYFIDNGNANIDYAFQTNGGDFVLTSSNDDYSIGSIALYAFSQTDIHPFSDNAYALGTISKRWSYLYTENASITGLAELNNANIYGTLTLSGLAGGNANLGINTNGEVVTVTGSTSQWINNVFDIYFNSGKVGIGTTSPNTNALLDLTVPNPATTPLGLLLPRLSSTDRGAFSLSAADKGLMVFDTDLNTTYIWDGAAWLAIGGSGISSLNGLTVSTQSLSVSNNPGTFGFNSIGSTHNLNIPIANGTDAGLLSATDWSTFNNKLDLATASATYQPLGSYQAAGSYVQTADVASGDVSGTFSSLSVDKIQGKTLNIGSIATNQVLQFDGTNIVGFTLPTSGVNSFSTTAPLANSGTASDPIISLPKANGSTDGYLGQSDWTIFNTKLGTLTNFGGDVSGQYNSISLDKIKGATINGTPSSIGQTLIYNGTSFDFTTPSTGLTSLNGLTTSSQTFSTSNNVGTFSFNSVGSTHTLNIPNGDASNSGLLSSANYTTFNNKVSLAQDLGGSPSSPSVIKIRGVAVSASLPANGQVLAYNNGLSQWEAQTIATSQWTTFGSDIYYNTGNVGIGTLTPAYPLDINGGVSQAVQISGNTIGLPLVNISEIGTGTAFRSTANAGAGVAGDFIGQVNISSLANVSVLQINGLGAPNGSVLTVNGTGLVGYGTLPATVASQWTTTTSGISYSAGAVGIGIGDPTFAQLQVVNNNATKNAGFFQTNNAASLAAAIYGITNADAYVAQLIQSGAGNTATALYVNHSGAGKVADFQGTGGVNISGNLTINGLAGAAGSVITVDGSGKLGIGTAAASQWTGTTDLFFNGNVGIAPFASSNAKLNISSTSAANNLGINLDLSGYSGGGLLMVGMQTQVASASKNITGYLSNLNTSSADIIATAFEASLSNISGTTGNKTAFKADFPSAGGTANRYGLYINNETANYLSKSLGIGTSTPNQALAVVGNSSVTGTGYFGGLQIANLTSPGAVLTVDGLGNVGMGTMAASIASWQLGGNSLTGVANFGTTSNTDLPFITNGSEWMRITSTGKIGIGTSTPGQALDIVGQNPGAALRVNTAPFGGSPFAIEAFNNTSNNFTIQSSNGYAGFNAGAGKFTVNNIANTSAALYASTNSTGTGLAFQALGKVRLDSYNIAGSVLTVDGLGNVGMGTISTSVSQWITTTAGIYTNSIVGIGVATFTGNEALRISSFGGTRGLALPYVTTAQMVSLSVSGLNTADQGMIFWDVDDKDVAVWDGVRFQAKNNNNNNNVVSDYWNLYGSNSIGGTNLSTSGFGAIGTADAYGLRVRTNNLDRMIVSSTGGVTINNSSSATEPALQVQGDITLGTTSTTNDGAVVIYLTNSIAGGASKGDIVVVGLSDNSFGFTSSATQGDNSVVGVLYEPCNSGNICRVAISGVVSVNTSASVNRGQHVICDSNINQGKAVSIALPNVGSSIGVFLESKASGTARALLR